MLDAGGDVAFLVVALVRTLAVALLAATLAGTAAQPARAGEPSSSLPARADVAPMLTQWMQDPSISRVAHWRTVRGYDDELGVFYVNDPMLGANVPLSYEWFNDNWQPFSYRWMVIYRPEAERQLSQLVGPDWAE